MIGIILAVLSSGLAEITDVIGKKKIAERAESLYTMGFLSLFFGALFFAATAIWRGSFMFSFASLPTFGTRLILELIINHIAIVALIKADRSTVGFMKAMTVPLLLAVDGVLGYELFGNQIAGALLIVSSVAILALRQGLSRKGLAELVIFFVGAVATLSLYKYDITHFNSVEAEQLLVTSALLVYFFIGAKVAAKENPLAFLKKPIFLGQSLASGLGSFAFSFAYVFAPASVITAALRAGIVFSSVASGRLFFGEKQFGLKVAAFAVAAFGLVLLAL